MAAHRRFLTSEAFDESGKRVPAIFRISGGNPSLGGYKLIPIPVITYESEPSSREVNPSVSIPDILRSFINISFTHLMEVSVPVYI